MSQAKVVFVTGSSAGGIGNAMCQAFAEKGCRVFATARRIESMENLPQSVERIQLDVLDESSCRAAIDQVIAKAGRIDILVNNAGAGGTGALCDFTVDDARKVFETNLFSVMRLTQLVVPHMASRSSGLIINIGSIVGNIPTPWAGVYAASKAAVHAWSNVLRMEVKGLGIRCLLVAPGAITSGFGKKQADSFHMPEDSLFLSVRSKIEERASMSQRSDLTMPAKQLADGIVKRALQSSPAAYYTAGGRALLFQILEWFPRSFVWWLLAKILGADQVRNPASKRQA